MESSTVQQGQLCEQRHSVHLTSAPMASSTPGFQRNMLPQSKQPQAIHHRAEDSTREKEINVACCGRTTV